MPLTLDDLRSAPNALAGHYSAFRVDERLLMTGHSHQAWPDVGFEAQKRAWLDAAEHADAKWEVVEIMSARVREGYRTLMGGCDGDLTLDANTHALVVRFLSAMSLRDRPRPPLLPNRAAASSPPTSRRRVLGSFRSAQRARHAVLAQARR